MVASYKKDKLMSRRRRKKSTQPMSGEAQGNLQVQKACKQAEDLINSNKPKAAIEMLEMILPQYRRNPDLHYYLGYAYVKAGDLWNGASHYQQVQVLRNDPSLWIPLAALYADLELHALSLHAYREVLRHSPNHPFAREAALRIRLFEADILEIAENLGLPTHKVEEGLRLMEQAQIELHDHNYSRCITLNRTAIKYLGDFPPPHNNLSLALSFSGEPEQAIQTAKEVLTHSPKNIQALAKIIRFLAWTGSPEEARTYWETLKQLQTLDDDQRHKMLEAATIMDDDQEVYRLINELESREHHSIDLIRRTELDLAIAEANLGIKTAQKRLKKLQDDIPWAGHILESLKKGQTGLGWSERYPYISVSDMISKQEFETFVNLITRQEELHPRKFRREVERFVARSPQIVLIARKLIIEDQQPNAGIGMLGIIGTPEAYAVLREFALSQTGSDDARMQALQELSEAEQINPTDTFRFWQDGEWQEIQFRSYELTNEPDTEYSQQVAELLERGTRAQKRKKDEQAEKAFIQVLELEPRVKEAYNNLGTLYAYRGESERAQEMFKKALEIDPLYVLACCNLAVFLLGDDKINEVEEMIKPLADLKRYTPQGIAMLSYIRAQIDIERERFDEARNNLEMALEIIPDHGPSSDLLERLELIESMRSGWGRWQAEQHKRNLATRAKRQKQIAITDPTLAESLGIFTKEVMVGMGRLIIPWGGWSTRKKAELHEYLVENLQDEYALKRLFSQLTDEDKNALKKVLARGGSLPWDEFDAAFGNDTEESPYWQYHEPETIMGRLRVRGLLTETMVDDQLLVAVPLELRELLPALLER
jgi:tetratricopeptide (TPR) repeat protein